MRRWPWISLLVAVALISSFGQGAAATVEERIAAAFATFQQALANNNGPAAAGYIDDRTAAFYEKVRRAALKTTQHQLRKQPLFLQVAVLLTRQHFSKDEIENTDGRGVYAKLAAAGAVGTGGPSNALTLVKIEPTKAGASAIAYVSLAGQPDNVGLRIFNQGGGWKIDLSRLLEAETKQLQNEFGVTPGMPKETVQAAIEKNIFPAIAQRSGKPASEQLWVPLAHAN